MRLQILLALALCTGTIAFGQITNTLPPRPLTMQECIDMALTKNLDLQIAHLSPEIARYNLNSARGAYDPTLSIQAEKRVISGQEDFDARKVNDYLPYEESFEKIGPDLSGRLPYGLSYDFDLLTGRRRAITDLRPNPDAAADFASGIRDTNNHYATAGVSVTQHLLKDFWIDPYQEKLLFRKSDLKISHEALRLEIMKTVLAVELQFYDLLAAREKIAVGEKALELKQQFLAETRRRVDVGDLPPLDGEQAQSQYQNTLTILTAARETLVEQRHNLAALLTDDFIKWTTVDVEAAGELTAIKEEPDRSEAFQHALKNRPDLIAARLAVEKSNVAVRFQKNQLFPSVDFTGSYGATSVESDSGSAISDALRFHGPDYSYGIVVSVPLGNITARNDYKAMQASKKVAELQLKKAEQDVLLQVAVAISRIQSRFAQIDSTRQARVYAERALGAEQKKLQNGLTTSFVVLQLQEALTGARMAELDALADYNKVVAQFAFADGSILERRHLAIEVK